MKMYEESEYEVPGPTEEERYIALMNFPQFMARQRYHQPLPDTDSTETTSSDEETLPTVHITIVDLNGEPSTPPTPPSPPTPPRQQQARVIRSLIKQRRRSNRGIPSGTTRVTRFERHTPEVGENVEEIGKHDTIEMVTFVEPKPKNNNGQPIMKFLLPEIFAEEKRLRNIPVNEEAVEFAKQMAHLNILDI